MNVSGRAFVFSAGVLLISASGSAAQTAAPRPSERAQLRHQVYVMEGALARAVEFGAQTLNREIRSVMPDLLMLAGQARARGVYLDNYGIFFDVEVPTVRQSVMWSVRLMLDRDQAGVRGALADLRRLASGEADPQRRAVLERAATRLELQVAPAGTDGAPAWGGTAAALPPLGSAAAAQAPAEILAGEGNQEPRSLPLDKPWVRDPNRAYTEAIQQALIDAMVDFSAPMRIRPEEWLTVAARDNEQRDSLAPQNPSDEVDTILLQISGSDLAAYRTGAIDRDEARKRVTIKKF